MNFKYIQPKVTVIIPVYNVENTLQRCIDSVIAQSLSEIEIILIDDGSPDNSGSICDEYAAKYTHIKVIHKNNEGLGLARNSGINIANGEYVAFLDSDDYVETNMYKALYEAAKLHRASAAFCGRNRVFNGDIGYKIGVTETTVWSGKDEIKEFLMRQIVTDSYSKDNSGFGATVTNAIFLNSILRVEKIYFESEKLYISEDGLFDIDFCANASVIVMIPQHYYNYSYNPNSLTAGYDKYHFDKTKRLYKVGKKKLSDGFKDKELLIQYEGMFVAAARVCVIQEVKHMSVYTFRETIKNINVICKDDVLQKVMQNYSGENLSFKKIFFNFLMKHNFVLLQILAIKLV